MPTVSQGLFKWLFWRGATLEDLADRLNHFWTFGLLLLFACIVSWKQGYNRPINCWVPAQFTDAMTRFTEETCWNSYFIHHPQDLVEAEEEILEMLNITIYSGYRFRYVNDVLIPFVTSKKIDISDDLLTKMSTTRTVYQWLPLVLCFQALLFKLPNILMYILHSYSGISFDKIAGLTNGYQNMNLQERGVICKQIARYVLNWCGMFGNWLPWRLLSLLWLLMKVLYCVNIVAQMCLVDTFLKTTDPPVDNSTSYGDVISRNLFENNATLWKTSPSFPRLVLCDFDIHQLRNIHRYTVQCRLSSNYVNEFIYMFLWVWLLFVAIVTCVSLVTWCLRIIVPIFRNRYIKNVMALTDDVDVKTIPLNDFNKFCNVMGEDGVMVLKLIGANSSDLLVSSVVCNMWTLQSEYRGTVRAGQVPSVQEVRVHPNAPVAAGTSDEAKKTE